MNHTVAVQPDTTPNAEKLIALTFDDGPSKTTMVEVLDLLEKYDVKATFFIVGRKLNELTLPVLQRALKEGHELANHSFNHVHMPELSEEKIVKEYTDCQTLIRDALGVDMYYFRPPFGKADDRMFRLIPAPFILCSAGARDGSRNGPDAEFRIRHLLSKAYVGGDKQFFKLLEHILVYLYKSFKKIVYLTEY